MTLDHQLLDLPHFRGSLTELREILMHHDMTPEKDFTLLYLEKFFRVIFLTAHHDTDVLDQIKLTWTLSAQR